MSKMATTTVKAVAVCAVCAALWACGSGAPPSPAWQLQARDATERASAAHLQGQQRVAQAEWHKAKQEAARTAQPEQVARVVLAQCALQVASLDWRECDELTPLQPDLSSKLLAYHRYLLGQVQISDVPLLPPIHQPVAQHLVGRTDPMPALQDIAEPVSQLVAAAVVLRHEQAKPTVLALGAAIASEQGWTRPVWAWLGAQAQWAEQTGQTALAERLQRRLRLLSAPTARATP